MAVRHRYRTQYALVSMSAGCPERTISSMSLSNKRCGERDLASRCVARRKHAVPRYAGRVLRCLPEKSAALSNSTISLQQFAPDKNAISAMRGSVVDVDAGGGAAANAVLSGTGTRTPRPRPTSQSLAVPPIFAMMRLATPSLATRLGDHVKPTFGLRMEGVNHEARRIRKPAKTRSTSPINAATSTERKVWPAAEADKLEAAMFCAIPT
mmetsp:Transcript_120706/g.341340  ORF Transcript_120706/g.341340 Transcript_120706/m.341340 type:complete len:210 (+) Transcript_120706:925-1554(+)